MNAQVIEADLTWIGGALAPATRVATGPDGRIAGVFAATDPAAPPATRRLENRALLPGFVNAHSHAFQRGLRGRGERFPTGAGSFWSWREAMYEFVATVDDDTFIATCRRAFGEMLDAGITTVGEFHYFHHRRSSLDFGFDDLVLEAARQAGIRIVLMNALYETGGINQPLATAQQRFATPDRDIFWERLDALVRAATQPEQTIGVVAHSIRAVAPDTLAEVYHEARTRGCVLHMHVEEQRREIEECRSAYGSTPMAAILDALPGNVEGFVAVHCTHTAVEDMQRFVSAGGQVCICPLTEANLGDGIASVTLMHPLERVSLGTDSNARISMLEEMRWLEYGQRLRDESRGVIRGVEGYTARHLLDVACRNGARALGLDAGIISQGTWADFVAIDLAHPALEAVALDELPEAIVFGAGDDVIADVCVGGRWRGRD